jgi:hypothetical protein
MSDCISDSYYHGLFKEVGGQSSDFFNCVKLDHLLKNITFKMLREFFSDNDLFKNTFSRKIFHYLGEPYDCPWYSEKERQQNIEQANELLEKVPEKVVKFMKIHSLSSEPVFYCLCLFVLLFASNRKYRKPANVHQIGDTKRANEIRNKNRDTYEALCCLRIACKHVEYKNRNEYHRILSLILELKYGKYKSFNILGLEQSEADENAPRPIPYTTRAEKRALVRQRIDKENYTRIMAEHEYRFKLSCVLDLRDEVSDLVEKNEKLLNSGSSIKFRNHEIVLQCEKPDFDNLNLRIGNIKTPSDIDSLVIIQKELNLYRKNLSSELTRLRRLSISQSEEKKRLRTLRQFTADLQSTQEPQNISIPPENQTIPDHFHNVSNEDLQKAYLLVFLIAIGLYVKQNE